MKKEENLVARLTARAAQVLLTLLYRNRVEVRLSLPEFATLLGLTRRQIVSALTEAEEVNNLVGIIPHSAGPPQVVSLLKLPEPEIRPEDMSESELLDVARKADESGEKAARVRVLQMVWDRAFPEEKYPHQRLSRDASDKWLADGRSVVWLTQVILKAVEHASSEIRSPRGFIERAIRNEEEHEAERRGGGDEVVSTEKMRELMRMGGRLFNGKD